MDFVLGKGKKKYSGFQTKYQISFRVFRIKKQSVFFIFLTNIRVLRVPQKRSNIIFCYNLYIFELIFTHCLGIVKYLCKQN